jgi:D-alanine-D-alanine ligase
MLPKKNIILFCGGRSAEHEISLRSARYIASLLSPLDYTVLVVGIDREYGGMHLLSLSQLSELTCCNAHSGTECYLVRKKNKVILRTEESEYGEISVVFPVLHGPGGEDGSMQGWLDMLGIPYVGPSVLGSALAMDKEVSKRLLQAHGIPVVPFMSLKNAEGIPSYDEASILLKNKAFVVKPCSLGSSVGISKITGPQDYMEKIFNAFRYDTEIIVESYIAGKELECAVLGHKYPRASGVGEICIQESYAIYSYEAKYLDPQGAKVLVHADISEDDVQKIRDLSCRAFQALKCSGMARVDFFLSPFGIFLNEINTIPGFTSISLYPKLWEAAGIAPKDLVAHLIACAYERFNERSKLELFPEAIHTP